MEFDDGSVVEDGYFTIVLNTSPYTFLGNRPFDLAPEATLDRPLAYGAGAELGPAFGAARLARLAASGESVERVCTVAPIDHVIEPEPELVERCRERRPRYRELYRALREHFPRPG